ncbi:MAG: NifU family protein [Rickettsiales bacterium]|nr:MAG: NifU family protein [Rickettsiales bacterium]
MFIQTEETPNPNALKFLPGVDISPETPVFLNSPKEAKTKSLLAVKIFQIDGVGAVFYGADFVTVTKSDAADWGVIKPEILLTIMDHLVAGFPIFDEKQKETPKVNLDDMSDIEKQIVEIIETRVRPSVAMDGGDIVYQGFENGVVYLQLRGACSGCPSASVTLKDGIESMLQHFVPEVKSVEAVESADEEITPSIRD